MIINLIERESFGRLVVNPYDLSHLPKSGDTIYLDGVEDSTYIGIVEKVTFDFDQSSPDSHVRLVGVYIHTQKRKTPIKYGIQDPE